MPGAELSGPLWDQAADVATTMVRLAAPGEDGLIDPDPILGTAAGFRDSHELALPCLLLALTELARSQDEDAATDLSATIPVKIAGRTKFVSHEQVRWVEAARDYVRLHTTDGNAHLVRMPISHLEERWSAYGFLQADHRTLCEKRRSYRDGPRSFPACKPPSRTGRTGPDTLGRTAELTCRLAFGKRVVAAGTWPTIAQPVEGLSATSV